MFFVYQKRGNYKSSCLFKFVAKVMQQTTMFIMLCSVPGRYLSANNDFLAIKIKKKAGRFLKIEQVQGRSTEGE